jgi:hypothetical protein
MFSLVELSRSEVREAPELIPPFPAVESENPLEPVLELELVAIPNKRFIMGTAKNFIFL